MENGQRSLGGFIHTYIEDPLASYIDDGHGVFCYIVALASKIPCIHTLDRQPHVGIIN